MKRILVLVLLFGIQAQAQETASATANPPAEMAVVAPASESTPIEASTKNLKESEIPVQLESGKKASTNENSVIKYILSLGIIGTLGCTAFFMIRKYKYKNPKSQATQIKVLSQHYLGPKKSLAIVRVAGESILIGVTDQNISMIKSLSLLDEDIPEEIPKDFSTVFSRKSQSEVTPDDAEGKDEFAISGIKDFVSSKLKNMRSLE